MRTLQYHEHSGEGWKMQEQWRRGALEPLLTTRCGWIVIEDIVQGPCRIWDGGPPMPDLYTVKDGSIMCTTDGLQKAWRRNLLLACFPKSLEVSR